MLLVRSTKLLIRSTSRMLHVASVSTLEQHVERFGDKKSLFATCREKLNMFNFWRFCRAIEIQCCQCGRCGDKVAFYKVAFYKIAFYNVAFYNVAFYKVAFYNVAFYM